MGGVMYNRPDLSEAKNASRSFLCENAHANTPAAVRRVDMTYNCRLVDWEQGRGGNESAVYGVWWDEVRARTGATTASGM